MKPSRTEYIFQKEELYRVLFQEIYLLVNDDLYDNDSIRKITTGNSTIHRKAIKALYTDNGFEILRHNIECECIPKITNNSVMTANYTSFIQEDANIPEDIDLV